jgi:hypothetical protein
LRTECIRLLVLSGALLFPSSASADSLAVERLDLDVRLDPQSQALYAGGKLTLRNTGGTSIEVLTLQFPAPLGSRTTCTAVWDANGELGWRSDPVDETQDQELSVLLRPWLKPGKKMTLGLNFEITLEGLPADAPASVSSGTARLTGTGWYPLPDGADPLRTNKLRLVVRLPKTWQVSAPVKMKRITRGALLAGYELQVERPVPGQTLFLAHARGEPEP